MLILTRKPNESIHVGSTIKIKVLRINGRQVRIGIEAPNDIAIYREEIYQHFQNEMTYEIEEVETQD